MLSRILIGAVKIGFTRTVVVLHTVTQGVKLPSIYEGGGWLCDACAEEHECGEEMLLPVVNSPRVGMCGYTGPA